MSIRFSQGLSTGISEGNTFSQRFRKAQKTYISGFHIFPQGISSRTSQAIARGSSRYHVVKSQKFLRSRLWRSLTSQLLKQRFLVGRGEKRSLMASAMARFWIQHHTVMIRNYSTDLQCEPRLFLAAPLASLTTKCEGDVCPHPSRKRSVSPENAQFLSLAYHVYIIDLYAPHICIKRLSGCENVLNARNPHAKNI